jgi:hypothetical protein
LGRGRGDGAGVCGTKLSGSLAKWKLMTLATRSTVSPTLESGKEDI